MVVCLHLSIRFREEYKDEMHCQGWICRDCDHLAVGECHHTSWCREDFCGAAAARLEQGEVVLTSI